ncbi:hypothetical protein ALI44B_04550 [Leifsonia sp. ALI-44-B]|uniref:M23 family metallopeptidase n=1 Tax=Leifsonia sp. ALI-44-B TaxID=1933776 RepID=UPI00097C8F66|nr:M23 family metallopeptidase [Leifsonia sp. ALI-44-B]ONI63900.1 hypothetical protein ALI44B_04550 [Leifsonia sp. ALI-44-B]
MGLYDLKNRTTKFGDKRSWIGQDKKKRSDTHKGDDYAATYGNDPVPAIQPGVVILNSYDPVFGHRVYVKRRDGLVVKYHMLNEPSPLKVGESVTPGQIIGRTGASAANASGNHVHVQTEKGAALLDPRPFILDYLAGNIPAAEIAVSFPSPAKTPTKPIEEDEDMKTLWLIQTPTNPVTGAKGPHWYLLNLSDYTYKWMQNDTQVNTFAALGVEKKTDQSPAIFAGFREVK